MCKAHPNSNQEESERIEELERGKVFIEKERKGKERTTNRNASPRHERPCSFSANGSLTGKHGGLLEAISVETSSRKFQV